jgi:acetoin utilization deacetylase AcuC-like enzyme
MGFCFYNNVAVAALAARAAGANRVLVLDWDVHHGNGIEHILYKRPDVMYISLHRCPALSLARNWLGRQAVRAGAEGTKHTRCHMALQAPLTIELAGCRDMLAVGWLLQGQRILSRHRGC